MSFVNLGTRNKGIFWEYASAYSFLNTKLPGTAFQLPDFFGFAEGMPNKHCQETTWIDLYAKKVFWEEFESGAYTPTFFEGIREVYKQDSRDLFAMLHNKQFYALSNEELASLCVQGLVYASSTLKPMLQGLFMMYLEDRFEAELKKILTPAEQEDVTYVQQTKATLLTMPMASVADREETEIVAIEEAFWKHYPEVSRETLSAFWTTSSVHEMLRALTEHFGWFRMEYMHEPFSAEDYQKEIEQRLRAGKIERLSTEAVREKLRTDQQHFFETHPGADYLERLVRVIHGFVFIHDETKEVLVYDHWLMRPLLREIARRLDISYGQLLFLSPEEIKAYLLSNTKADQSLITERKRARAILLKNGVITIYTGDEAIRLAAELLPEESIGEENITEFKGVIAFPGIVRGKAVVIQSINDRDKFSKGDIFVTHDGSAEFNLFLQQAGAIVTNEGGMICHAAVVAREMKTPAIVGTKIATKVIKDGDTVEVDATHGVIRILTP